MRSRFIRVFRQTAAVATAMLSVIMSPTAQADVSCAFTIVTLSITPDGWINGAFSGGGSGKTWWICPVSGSVAVNDGYASRTITSDNCKAIYSQLLTLKVSAKQVTMQFHGPADCSSAALPADGTQPNPFPTIFGFSN